MTNHRTTSNLVKTAIEGAMGAGLPVHAVDVHGGGFVRILFFDPEEAGALKEGTLCDDIFEAQSD